MEHSVTGACTALSRRRNSLANGHDDAISASSHDKSTKKRKTSHKKLHARVIRDQTNASFSEDNQLTHSLSNPIDPLETQYDPSGIVSSSETISSFDPSTLWNLPTPNESVGYPLLSTEWPYTQNIHESTNEGRYYLFCDLPEELIEDTVSKALGFSDSDKDQDDNLQDGMIDMRASYLSGRTALHLGARKGHQRIVAMLIDKGGNVDDRDNLGQSALHMAAAGGHQAVVQLLIGRGANLDLKDARGRTSLHLAAESGHVQTVQSLVQQMPVKEVKDALGRTPLHVAIECGHEDIVRLLLDNGADPRAKVSP